MASPLKCGVIQTILIDIDGTLVGKNGIHESTWPALETARQRGVHVGLCTGRIGGGRSLELARQISPHDLHVFHSGAVITTPDGPAAYTSDLPRLAYTDLVALSRREAEVLEVYTSGAYFIERETERSRVHAQHLEMEPGHTDLLGLRGHLVRAQWVVDEETWARLRPVTAALEGIEISPATAPWSPGTIFASVTRAGTSKAGAIRWLAQHDGIGLENLAMIGDGENDLEAIQVAGLGIAMGNAPKAVQEAANVVVGDVDDGGLAQAIYCCLEQ
jgi:Cof subfamily protein (haloacid dehalogenase superfamily)